jgi:hypothetical protein
MSSRDIMSFNFAMEGGISTDKWNGVVFKE